MKRRALTLLAVLAAMAGGVVAYVVSRPALLGRVASGAERAFLFQNVNVFDGESALGARDVRVRDGVITEVAEAGALTPGDEVRIDGAGRTLLPGLVDLHGHVESHGEPIWAAGLPKFDDILQAYLYAGVTTVALLQGSDEVAELVRDVRAGKTTGPSLYAAGPRITAPGGFPLNVYSAILGPLVSLIAGGIHEVSTPEEAVADVEATVRTYSPDLYKVTSDTFPGSAPKLAPEVLAAALKRADELKLRTAGHFGQAEDFVPAAEAGLKLFAHLPNTGVFTEAQVERLVELRVPFVSTLLYLTSPMEVGRAPSKLDKELLAPRLVDALVNPPKDFKYPLIESNEAAMAQLTKHGEVMRQNFQLLHKAGAVIYAGTDSGSPGVIPGASLHRELLALVAAGFSNEEALRAATSAPADFLDEKKSFGRIAKGQRADLLLVQGNPLEDLSATQNIAEVFQAGRRLTRSLAK